MSTILSWDVGIKNLAYCMLQKDNNKFKILEWGVINLLDDAQLCQMNLRGGGMCPNIAKYKINHSEEKIYKDHDDGICICEKHKDKIEPTLINIEKHIPKKTKKQTEEKIQLCELCESEATCKINNIDTIHCWCENHRKKGLLFEKKIKVKKLVAVNCKKLEPQVLAEKLFTKLDTFESFMNVDTVIIEDQPTFIHRTMSAVASMKRVASMLHSYFILRGIKDKQNNSNIKVVDFVSPSNKLKVNKSNTTTILKKTENTKIYKMTKQLGIKYCEALLDEKWGNFFAEFKKKDDPADAFLAGLKYMFDEEFPEEYVEKLKTIGLEEDAPKKRSSKKVTETTEVEKKPRKKSNVVEKK
jgi:hypothetical protein